jgi:hypothetical protein
VLLSITPTFVNIKKQEGKKFAYTLEELKKDVDKPLIAILTLNTIAHTVGAILVGVEADKLPYEVNILGVNMVGIISAIMTFFNISSFRNYAKNNWSNLLEKAS